MPFSVLIFFLLQPHPLHSMHPLPAHVNRSALAAHVAVVIGWLVVSKATPGSTGAWQHAAGFTAVKCALAGPAVEAAVKAAVEPIEKEERVGSGAVAALQQPSRCRRLPMPGEIGRHLDCPKVGSGELPS
eukprot:4827223-Pleurochrysis_carterae.AAC.4